MRPAIALMIMGASAAVIAWQMSLRPPPLPAPPSDAGSVSIGHPAAAPAAVVFPTASQYGVIEERILFTPERRVPPLPVAVADGVAPPSEPQPPALRLVGTFVSASARLALLAVDGKQHPQAVRQGETIAGWVVNTIASRQVAIQTQDGRATVLMLENRPKSSPRNIGKAFTPTSR